MAETSRLTLIPDHLNRVSAVTTEALRVAADGGDSFDGIVFHSGSATTYHAQDREVDFQPVPHFMRFVPVAAPDHFVVFRPGAALKLVSVVVDDFWYEPHARANDHHLQRFEVVTVPSVERAREALESARGCAYVGNNPDLARRLGVEDGAIEPPALLAALDWFRTEKTPYEIESIREAAQRAGAGHRIARQLVAEGASERSVHAAFLEATGQLEMETPYTNIMGWDDRAAILHYRTKRAAPAHPAHVFLIDAGATVDGYASDITRTYTRPGVHPIFAELVQRTETLQRQFVGRVRPGVSFVGLHEAAMRGVGAILRDLGVLRIDPDEALARGVLRTFLPHGLGHHLGLQVHDVGGTLKGPLGPLQEPPSAYPYLRNLRDLAADQVVTIEPGVYFIPTLLRALRASRHADAVSWDVVDQLVACGGIRIEDDVRVTPEGPEDLSRPFVPGNGT